MVAHTYWAVIGVAVLHVLFALGELFPWPYPFVLRLVSEKFPVEYGEKPWNEPQQSLVAAIVHNVAIYNLILAGGLFWAAQAGAGGLSMARVLLIGVVVAGVFGTVTLKSKATAFQAMAGILGLILL